MEFLNDFFQPHTVETSRVLLSFLFAFLNGCIIYFIYKKTYGGVFSSSGFRISLLLLPLLVTLIILTVVNNLAMSLARLSLFSQAKFFLKIVICNNINQLWNFGSFTEKHN